MDNEQYDSMMEVLNEFLVIDEKAEHEILYSVFRKVSLLSLFNVLLKGYSSYASVEN